MEEVRLFPPTPDEIILTVLKKYRLPNYYLKEIHRYLCGELSENRLVCCHSGCDIYENNIFETVRECKELLSENSTPST
ncbi:MAG: hypothetical protein JJT78_07090 [Leptospira sp.]|nr:hypothetical protein [Leptospira sp.]